MGSIRKILRHDLWSFVGASGVGVGDLAQNQTTQHGHLVSRCTCTAGARIAAYAIRPQHVTAPLGLMIPQPTAGTQSPHSFDLAGEELYVSIRDLGQGAFGLVRLAVNRCSVSSDPTVAFMITATTET